ncbi:MAG: MBL fold metallo-hydrolase [Bacteroidales bacterium]|nr:MBL fold metallo-hydrolase [Bacteroidales bacterium]
MRKIVAMAMLCFLALSCAEKAPKTADCGRHGLLCENGWFVVKDITPENGVGKVYMISEHAAATCYLVTGTKAAMLIDTGIGVGDLAGLVRGLTDLPLIVVNTHGHPDHMGANYQFAEAWVPEKDMDVYHAMDPFKEGTDLEAYVASNAKDFAYDTLAVKANAAEVKAYEPCTLTLFNPGQTWDLGDKLISTIELGGHTPGSIMFLDETDDMLFSGDAMNGYLWMWLDTCLSIEEYEQNLAAAIPQFKCISHVYGGHEFREAGATVEQSETMLADVRSVLAGEVEPVVTPKPMGMEGTVNVYYFKTWLLWAK